MVGLGTARAASLQKPSGEPILEIGGSISVHNGDGVAVFDRAMVEALGTKVVVTTTPWHTGPVRFEGVSLDQLMKTVGAEGRSVKATALDDYSATVPLEDFARHGVILALKRDGQYMAPDDQGPLFIIYPYDSNPELHSETYYARSVWQVKRLDVQK